MHNTSDIYACLRKLGFYIHPLGFYYATIKETKNYKIRLHIWDKHKHSSIDTGLSIHDHVFNLKSSILFGSIKNTTFETFDTMATQGLTLYKVDYRESLSTLIPISKKIGIKESASKIYSQGEMYEIPKSTFHKTEVISNTAITLCKMNNDLSCCETPRVIGNQYYKKPLIFDREKVSFSIVRDILQILDNPYIDE